MKSTLVIAHIICSPEIPIGVFVERRERGIGVLRRALLDGPGIVGRDLRGAVGVGMLVLPEGEEAVDVYVVQPEDRIEAGLREIGHVTGGYGVASWSTGETVHGVVDGF